jgi:hypothetical protein
VIIDTQAVTTIFTILGISVGVVVVLAAAFVTCSAAWRRYDRTARIRGVERYLAAVASRPYPGPRARSR